MLLVDAKVECILLVLQKWLDEMSMLQYSWNES